MDWKLILLFIFMLIILFLLFSYITRPAGITPVLDATLPEGVTIDQMGSTKDEVNNNFSFSIWAIIDDWNYRYGQEKVIFVKQGASSGDPPQFTVSLAPMQNNLIVRVRRSSMLTATNNTDNDNTSSSDTVVLPYECEVVNIPLQKWINIITTLQNKSLDIYINGKLVKTCVMDGEPNVQNNIPVTLTPGGVGGAEGGFSGKTAKFNYYSQPLSPQECWNVYKNGWSDRNIFSINTAYNVDLVITKNGEEIAKY